MKEKFNIKKYITVCNLIILVITLIYLLDRYIPLPDGYTGFTWWMEDTSPAINYIFGNCGGIITNKMALGPTLQNGTAIYRHLTSIFIHGGLLHLIANIIGLYYAGNYVEKKFGFLLALVSFFLIAFAESFITDPLFMAIAPDKAIETSNYITCGSSGGIFGLMGMGLASLFFNTKSFKEIDKSTLTMSLFYGITTTYIVDFGWTTVCHNVALILGLIFGTIIILPFYILKKGKFYTKDNQELNKDDKL